MNQATATIPNVSSFKMLRAMVGIGALCGLLIVSMYEVTLPRVEFLRQQALEKAIFRVVPGISSIQGFDYIDGQFVPSGETSNPVLYAGYDDNNEFKGVAITAAGQGYADIIRILYGYKPEEQAVVGFYVLESKETPGLGDKIEKDENFLANFEKLDVSLTNDQSVIANPVVTVKQGAKTNPWEVDGITGATISSRAIGSIIQTSSEEWMPRIYKNLKDFEKETQ